MVRIGWMLGVSINVYTDMHSVLRLTPRHHSGPCAILRVPGVGRPARRRIKRHN